MSYATATSDPGSGGIVWGIDTISGSSFARMKMGWGVENAFVDVSASNPLPVGDAGGSLTIDNAALSVVGGGAEATALRVTLASDSTGLLSIDDNGASLTVDAPVGTPVFVRLSDGSAAISTLPVSAASLPLPSGASTSAKQDTEITALQAIQTAAEILDNAVSGSEMQVDVVAALPAGTNNIGDVDVLSVIPGTGATNLGKAIDAIAGATDTGVAPLAVRDDALSALTPIEGDYAPVRVDANGALWVIHSGTMAISAASLPLPSGAATSAKQDSHTTLLGGGLPAALGAQGALKVEGVASGTAIPISVASIPSHAVTNAGTFAVQVDGNALTALQLIDDPVFADEATFTPATSKLFAVGFLADEASTDSCVEGGIGVARITLDRKIHVAAELESNSMRAGGTSVTPKFAVIDAATSGDNTLVAAVNPKKIRVHSLWMVAAGTVTVRFESGASGTALSGQANLVANTGFVLPFNPYGWFETASNTLLNLELSAAVSVDGGLQYSEIA